MERDAFRRAKQRAGLLQRCCFQIPLSMYCAFQYRDPNGALPNIQHAVCFAAELCYIWRRLCICKLHCTAIAPEAGWWGALQSLLGKKLSWVAGSRTSASSLPPNAEFEEPIGKRCACSHQWRHRWMCYRACPGLEWCAYKLPLNYLAFIKLAGPTDVTASQVGQANNACSD